MNPKEPKPHVRPNDLSQGQLDEALKRLTDWKLVHRPNARSKSRQATELHRQFAFASFEDAMDFMHKASGRMTALDHHPEWLNAYKTVSVWLTTWEIGYKPSVLDVEIAAHLNELYRSYKRPGPAGAGDCGCK